MTNETTEIKPGMKCLFRYPDYGTPNSHPDYTAHSGQQVTVDRQLTDAECDPENGPAFFVKAADGWIGNAHASELEVLMPDQFVWSNYILQRRYSTGSAARRNRGSYAGHAVHRIVIDEIVKVIDEEAELAKKSKTIGQRFLVTRKPTQFSAHPACGCTGGQNAAREVVGATVTCKKCGA